MPKYSDVIALAQAAGLDVKVKSGETKVFGPAGIGKSVAVNNPKKDGTTSKIYCVGFDPGGLVPMKTGYKSITGQFDLAAADVLDQLGAAFLVLAPVKKPEPKPEAQAA